MKLRRCKPDDDDDSLPARAPTPPFPALRDAPQLPSVYSVRPTDLPDGADLAQSKAPSGKIIEAGSAPGDGAFRRCVVSNQEAGWFTPGGTWRVVPHSFATAWAAPAKVS